MTAPARAWAQLHLPALDCPRELALVERALDGAPGVLDIRPDYLGRRLRVEFDPARIDPPGLTARLRAGGLEAVIVGPDAERGGKRAAAELASRPALPRGVWLGAGLTALAATAWWSGFSLAGHALAVAASLVAGWPVLRKAIEAVRRRSLDMHALVTLAALGALATGYTFEAAVTLVLFGVALWLESDSLRRARQAIESLAAMTPAVAHRVIDGGQLVDVAPEAIRAGERLRVLPGERFAVDGRVVSGRSSVNQAPITGESLPVDKAPGDTVYAGSLNGAAALEIDALGEAAESTLAEIGRLVEMAESRRSPTERVVDRFAAAYTPAVVALAVVVASVPPWLWGGGWLEWFHRGLVLLVVACPCALVISTPVAILCGLHRAARLGVLVKGGALLEAAGRVDALAFDKTGTLTEGRPAVVAVEPAAAGVSPERLLAVAAALERHSEHTLARAIVAAAEQRGLELPTAADVRTEPGRGLVGRVAGETVFLGSERWLAERAPQAVAASPAPEETDPTTTAVALATPRERLGTIRLGDRVRDDAEAAVRRLHALGVRPLVLLSGDRRPIAEALGRQLQLDAVEADLLPAEKLAAVGRLLERHPGLAMVGDGVNDAPALAAARLGIALGTEASRTAMESADVVVLAPHVERVADLVELGRATRRTLSANIAAAVAIKLGVAALAAAGYAPLWLAVAADVGASLLVVANSLRLLGRGLPGP